MGRDKMRDWLFIDRYYQELTQDIYDQPNDSGHSLMAKEIINKWFPDLDGNSVLDVGCGTGFCSEFVENNKKDYLGIEKGISSKTPFIIDMDFNFLSKFKADTFDIVLSRHTLEHSPFPLLTLMEWHRVAKMYLLLVLPNPEYYTFIGKNHYSVMDKQQSRWLLRRAGWEVLKTDYSEPTELRFLCRKRERIGAEGYISKLTNNIYEADRDGK